MKKTAQYSLNQKGLIGWIVLIIVVLIIAGLGFLIYKAPQSLPGDPVYPVKEVLEDLRHAVTEASNTERANLYIGFSDERLKEVEGLIAKKDTQFDALIKDNLKKMLDFQEKAVANLDKSRGKVEYTSDVQDRIEDSLLKQTQTLKKLLLTISPTIFHDGEYALRATQVRLEKVKGI